MTEHSQETFAEDRTGWTLPDGGEVVEGAVAAPDPPSKFSGSKSRRWLWILIAIAAVTGLAIVVLTFTNTPSSDQTMVEDDMNRGEGPFVVESDSLVELGYEDGGYAMVLAATAEGQIQRARHIWRGSREAVHVGISYQIRRAPIDGAWTVRLGCSGSSDSTDSQVDPTYYIAVARDPADGVYVFLVAGEDVVADRRFPLDTDVSQARLELDCVSGDNGDSTEIVGYMDGREIVRASHPAGFGPFRAIAILAALTVEAEMDVLWDDALAAELS